MNVNKPSVQGNISSSTVNKYRLYNLLFSGRITLQEYYQAIRELNDGKKEN